MNPSTYSSRHTTVEGHPYTPTGAHYGTTSPHVSYADKGSRFHNNPSPSAEGWSGECLALGPWSDADQARFEALFAAEVTNTSPSGPHTVVPMQSQPSYGQEHRLFHGPTETSQPRAEPFHPHHPYSNASTSSRPSVVPPSKQALPKSVSPDRASPPQHSRHHPGERSSTAASSHSSRSTRSATHRGSPASPYSSPSPEPSPRTRTSSIIVSCPRRNAAAHTDASFSANNWQCPHCPYVQHNRRSPDLRRHIQTHTRGAEVADWVCCGVPVLIATELGMPAEAVREAEEFEFDGVLMVGGCRKAFSRRDALIRHLQREKGRCFGDAQSLYQRGNNKESR